LALLFRRRCAYVPRLTSLGRGALCCAWSQDHRTPPRAPLLFCFLVSLALALLSWRTFLSASSALRAMNFSLLTNMPPEPQHGSYTRPLYARGLRPAPEPHGTVYRTGRPSCLRHWRTVLGSIHRHDQERPWRDLRGTQRQDRRHFHLWSRV
jgi:hypothetical protein